MLIPDESQNLVAVMSAMTVPTPGAKAAQSSSPTLSALEMSISVGKVTTTDLAGAGSPRCGSRIRGSLPRIGRRYRGRPSPLARCPQVAGQSPRGAGLSALSPGFATGYGRIQAGAGCWQAAQPAHLPSARRPRYTWEHG